MDFKQGMFVQPAALSTYFNISDDACALQWRDGAAIKVGKERREMKYYCRVLFNGLTEK